MWYRIAMSKPTLLETALRTAPVNEGGARPLTAQDLEVAEAWLNGTINLKQLATALGNRNMSGCYVFLARAARELWRRRP